MTRRFFRKYTPDPDRIRTSSMMRVFGKILHQPNLWHLNRASVSRAFAIGMFWAFIPMPFQMLPSVFCAIQFRANVAISAALVWITNPFTMPFFYYMQYLIGRRLLGIPASSGDESLLSQFMNWRNWIDWQWVSDTLMSIGAPIYVGSLVFAIAMSVSSYLIVQLAWRQNIRSKWSRRISLARARIAAGENAGTEAQAVRGERPLKKSA